MLRIHRHAGDLERSEAVGAWVYQIARNAIADHYRRPSVRREQPSGFDFDRPEPQAPEPVPGELRGEVAACLAPLLDQLSAPAREAITLTELEGLTQASAAARLGLSTSGMKSRVQRARTRLRELLVACCEIELDSRGAITSYRPRGACDCCGAAGAGIGARALGVPDVQARHAADRVDPGVTTSGVAT